MSVADRQIGVPARSRSQPPVMHTVLSAFSDSFDTSIRPLLDPLHEATKALAATPDGTAARRTLPKLRELHHQLETLVGKVAAQQAYVLIFGPLKSGKSTFMNALSGTYVSEVTSLPAYPCMVYVTHSDTPGFVATYYDGRTTEVMQREALSELVADAHRELRLRIREVEADGEIFDPAVHMPNAIRRIDVQIGMENLAQSGAVLVDTPGLYTRMKFGYDRMTRDFRDTAACAIFIVKTDNLFLEQVFDEFGELLELFSRIFLVVNVDSTKKDLLPDGTLTPSLEQKSPWEVIEAFEHLSMTTPLANAVEEGRLEIYAVDLLRAASRRLRAHAHRRDMSEPETKIEEPGSQEDFDNMLQDLTGFLNSNDYLKAFLDDSLRRSRTLIEELGATLQDEAVRQLSPDAGALQQACGETRSQVETLRRLRQIEWRAHVQGLEPKLREHVAEIAVETAAQSSGPMEAAVEKWFENSQSLHHLLEQELHPIFVSAHGRLTREAETTMKRRASDDLAGLASTEDVLSDLLAVGMDIRAAAESALDRLKARAAAVSPQLRLTPDIPVRRSFMDRLLLRSGAKVRRRLFGPAEEPDAQIPAETKARVIGDRGREAIREALLSRLASSLDEAARSMPDLLVGGYAERFEQDLQSQLERKEQQAGEQLETTVQRLRKVRQADESLSRLGERLTSFSLSIEVLIDRFGQSDEAAMTH